MRPAGSSKPMPSTACTVPNVLTRSTARTAAAFPAVMLTSTSPGGTLYARRSVSRVALGHVVARAVTRLDAGFARLARWPSRNAFVGSTADVEALAHGRRAIGAPLTESERAGRTLGRHGLLIRLSRDHPRR